MTRDNYDKELLKAVKAIAKNLEGINKTLNKVVISQSHMVIKESSTKESDSVSTEQVNSIVFKKKKKEVEND